MLSRYPRSVALATATAMTLVASSANALTIAQVTRNGYILIDEPDAEFPYNGSAGGPDGQSGFGTFVADVTTLLDSVGAPHPDFIAVMQTQFDNQVFAFYQPFRNHTRGLGFIDPQGAHSEFFDLNANFGTAFSIDGAVFLNEMLIYSSASDVGAQVICPQEFGHRFLTQIKVPPFPVQTMSTDAGITPDASIDDATVDLDGAANADDADVDVATIDDAPAPVDVPVVAQGPALPRNALLGRDGQHWSYFLNTGGSPVEGNAWEELSPGLFQVVPAPIQFSPLDLYMMGLAPPSQVPPFFVIAEPNVMGQLDTNGNALNAASPPEGFSGGARPIQVRGRKVTYSINDIISVNGPRDPAYSPPDAGNPAGDVPVREMRTAWILLTTRSMYRRSLITQFDHAVDVCAGGYAAAAQDLAHIVPVVMPIPDAGTDASTDATDGSNVVADGTIGSESNGMMSNSGCHCRATPTRTNPRTGWAMLAMAALGLASQRRRRPRSI